MYIELKWMWEVVVIVMIFIRCIMLVMVIYLVWWE